MPSDTHFAEQWGMRNTGQSGGARYITYTPGVPGADIDAPRAWDICTGSSSVIVGVIDTGIDYTHPDLAPNIWTNAAEVPDNGIDDDGNGYIDDVRGWNFYDDNKDPMDDDGHGTHCAGIIGATGNNSTGVAGVCWRVSLVPIRCLGGEGGTYSDAIQAIHYATGLNVAFTSNSWAGTEYSEAMREAVDAAEAADILFIAGAANAASNNDVVSTYPANFTNANVISVAATDQRDQIGYYSNYGPFSVHLGAPGSWIVSTVPGGRSKLNTGTSMAAPQVAGACALVKAYRPERSGSAIKRVVLSSAELTPAMTGRVITGGRLNIYEALLTSRDLAITSSSGRVSVGVVGGPFTPSARVHTMTNYSLKTAQWTVTHEQPWLDLSRLGGTLLPGASAVVAISINAQSALLPQGTFQDVITFTNLTTGRTVTRLFTLYVGSRDNLTEYFGDIPTDPSNGDPATVKHFDLSHSSITYIPDDSSRGYSVFRESATSFKTDPSGGTRLSSDAMYSGGEPVILSTMPFGNWRG